MSTVERVINEAVQITGRLLARLQVRAGEWGSCVGHAVHVCMCVRAACVWVCSPAYAGTCHVVQSAAQALGVRTRRIQHSKKECARACARPQADQQQSHSSAEAAAVSRLRTAIAREASGREGSNASAGGGGSAGGGTTARGPVLRSSKSGAARQVLLGAGAPAA